MYKYILFDLDGTLTDPGEGITKSVEYALNKYGIQVEDRRSLYKFIGPPLTDSFSEFYGFSEEKSIEAVSFYREYFGVTGLFENEVYPGITSLLEKVKSNPNVLKLAIATSKPEEYTLRILEKFDLMKYFDVVCGATMSGSRVKKADIIAYALESAGVEDRSEVIMVGDRHHDIDGAKANGIKSIGVTYGYGSREELEEAGADYIVSAPMEILDYAR